MTNPYRDDVEDPKPKKEVPPGVPAKQKVEVVPVGPIRAEITGVPVKAVVVEEKPGQVNFWDKTKAYYHTVITVLGGILVFLNEVTPLTDALGGDVQRYVTLAIIGLTAVMNAVTSNEKWVNKP